MSDNPFMYSDVTPAPPVSDNPFMYPDVTPAGGFQQMQDKTESDIRLRKALATRAAIEKGANTTVGGPITPVESSGEDLIPGGIPSLQNFVTGVGRGTDQLLQAVKEGAAYLRPKIPNFALPYPAMVANMALGNPPPLDEQRKTVDELAKLDQPLLNTPEGQVGNLVGSQVALPFAAAGSSAVRATPGAIRGITNALRVASGGSIPKVIPEASSIARGGIPSFLGDVLQGGGAGAAAGATDPYGEQGGLLQNMQRGGTAGMIGGGIGNVVSRFIQPAGQLTPQQMELAKNWEAEGLSLPASILAGPGTLPNYVGRFGSDSPWSQLFFGPSYDKMRAQVQNVVGQRAGMTAQEMADRENNFALGNLAPARARDSALREGIKDQPAAPLTPELSAALDRQQQFLANKESVLRDAQPSPALNPIEDVRQAMEPNFAPQQPALTQSYGGLTGNQFQGTVEGLRRAANATQNPTDRAGYNLLKQSLNRWAEDAYNVPGLGVANQQSVVRDALRNPGTVDVRTNDLSFGKFARDLKSDNSAAYMSNPLPLQHFGNMVGQLQDTFPNSGTTARATQQMLGQMLGHAITGGATGLAVSGGDVGIAGDAAAGIPIALLAAALAGQRPRGYHTSSLVDAAARGSRFLTPAEMAIWDEQRARQNDLPTAFSPQP